jgi:hypothetical protein
VGRRSRLGLVVASVLAGVVVVGVTACGGSDSGNGSGEDGTAIQKFFDQLDEAVRKGDTDFRVARLHPAVIDRYGEQQCRDFLSSPQAAPDPSRKDKVERVDKPESFDFTTDDGAVSIPDAQLVLVEETFRKKTTTRELHVAKIDGEFRYFIDCGTPLMRQ